MESTHKLCIFLMFSKISKCLILAAFIFKKMNCNLNSIFHYFRLFQYLKAVILNFLLDSNHWGRLKLGKSLQLKILKMLFILHKSLNLKLEEKLKMKKTWESLQTLEYCQLNKLELTAKSICLKWETWIIWVFQLIIWNNLITFTLIVNHYAH